MPSNLQNATRNEMGALDIFSGSGGMSLGLTRAGFTIVAAADFDKRVEATYIRNSRYHPKATFVCTDLSQTPGPDLLRQAEVGCSDVVLVAGGPPCKGFSSANVKTRNGDNPHNGLVDHFFRIVAEIKPKLFLMENVMGLLWFSKDFLQQCEHLRELYSLGYRIDFISLNALNYGVPQNRRRLLIVGNRLGKDFCPPQPTHGNTLSPHVTLGEAIIGDLPPLKENGSQICDYASDPTTPYQKAIRGRVKKAHNHIVSRNSEKIKLRMSKVPIGGNWKDIPPEFLGIHVSHSCLYRRLDPARPSVTLGNFRKNMLIHPYENRHLSLREAARLQSFPDDYYFDGPVTLMQQQIADATPPLLIEAVARQLKQLIE